MLVDQHGADAEHEHRLALAQERLGDGGQQARRRAFDDEIGERLQFADRHHRRRLGEMSQPRRSLAAIFGRDGRQRAAGDAAIERLRYLQADRAEAGDGDPDRGGAATGRGGFMLVWCNLFHVGVDPASGSDSIRPIAS